MVVEVPSGATAGGFLDIWQRPITDVGQTGPDRGGGAKYLIVPPNSDIQEMTGYIVARSPSNQVWFASRMLHRDPKVAEEVAHKHKVYAWKDRENAPATTFIPVGGKDWTSAQPTGLAYWQYLSDVLQPEPIEDRDRVMMGMLVPLGIKKGKSFDPNERQKKILIDAALVGEMMARARMPSTSVTPEPPSTQASIGSMPTSMRPLATRSACKAARSILVRSTLRHRRTKMATTSMEAKPTAFTSSPMRLWGNFGRSLFTIT